MPLTLVTAPTVDPITLAEAKSHLHVDVTADDTLIAALIKAATAYLDGRDGILGRALVEQTWDLKLDRFPGHRSTETGYQGPYFAADAIRVPLPPLRSVTSITYIDANGDAQTLSSSLYTVDAGGDQPGRIVPVYGETWPSTRGQVIAVTVRFVAGYAPTAVSPPDYRANVPTPVKQALKLLVAELYEHREEVNVGNIVNAMPFASKALLAPYQVWDF